MELGTDERRLAVEVLSTLVHVKSVLCDLILEPAGIPRDVYGPLMYKRDPSTGKILSKRQIAPLILEELETKSRGTQAIRAILKIAATWDSYHLADNEYAARAVSQKARELLGTIETMEAREARQREIAREQELARLEHERAEMIERPSSILLMMFDELATSGDPQKRGYLLQELLKILFDVHGVTLVRPFTRNEKAEQIDGAFKLEGWHYLVECRWRAKLADTRELDGLVGQVGRSGKQTMGLFIGINGWSENVPKLLKQNPRQIDSADGRLRSKDIA